MSHAQFGRIERGMVTHLTFDQAGRAGLAVGLRVGARAYPSGDPVRDAGQLRLLERFVALLPPLRESIARRPSRRSVICARGMRS